MNWFLFSQRIQLNSSMLCHAGYLGRLSLGLDPHFWLLFEKLDSIFWHRTRHQRNGWWMDGWWPNHRKGNKTEKSRPLTKCFTEQGQELEEQLYKWSYFTNEYHLLTKALSYKASKIQVSEQGQVHKNRTDKEKMSTCTYLRYAKTLVSCNSVGFACMQC